MSKQGVRMRIAAVAMLGAAAALTGIPAAAQAATPAGLIRYVAQDPGATHVVLKGTPVPGGCTFTATGGGSTTRHSVTRQVETAYDSTTCTSYLDQVKVKAAPAAAASSGGAGKGAAGGGRALVSEGAASALAAYCLNPYRSSGSYSRDACVHSWFQNPSGVHVNDVRNEVQWNPGGGCATYGPSYASYYYTWASGWYNTLDRFSSTFACSGVTSLSRESFTHNTYCSGGAASVTYDPGYVTGYADGSYYWSVTWRKTGSCSLSFGLLDES